MTARGLAHTLSLPRFRLHRLLGQLLERHARGRCLDAGAGRSPYGRVLEALGCDVFSVDVEDRGGSIDLAADLQDLNELPDASFDTVLCTQVLEHLPRPWDAVAEISRVLRPNGVAMISVPHLSVIHEAPHDYFRYTRFGLESLLERAGLEVLEIESTGGLVCFLGHGTSVAMLGTVGAVPGLRWPVWLINYVVLVRSLGVVDRILNTKTIYPCDYVLAARKPPR